MKLKILLFDIETSPNLAYVWGKYEQNALAFKEEWKLLCYAYKWLDEPDIKCIAQPDFEARSEKPVVESLWHLFDQAEIIIAHNGDQFDIRKANAKFVEHGLLPPSPYKTIDTKKYAKKYFNFNSNSLEDLGIILGLGKKLQTGGKDLWLDCMAGVPEAWERMKEYNRRDVELLESVYLKLRMWVAPSKPATNIAWVDGKKFGCPQCGSEEYQKRGRDLSSSGCKYRVLCTCCGKWRTETEHALLRHEAQLARDLKTKNNVDPGSSSG